MGEMRDDWNERAREDAPYFVAFGRRQQSDVEFFATATDVINDLERELRRAEPETRAHWRALEIGCGPGRLMRPMSRHFLELHGVDVSDEMIGLAQEKLRDVPSARLHVGDGASLTGIPDASIDFAYSYAVFQHIPAREAVLNYLRETVRVLRPGGLARFQFNGMSGAGEGLDTNFNTWAGVRFTSHELLEFAEAQGLQVLALEGVSTQYMWTTWRKPTAPVSDPSGPAVIRRITNASSSEPVAPSRGRFASISLRVEGLPADAGLNHLRVTVGPSFGTVTYIGPLDRAGWQQVNVDLPMLEETGLLPVQLHWLDQPLSDPATLRIIPPGPAVPRMVSLSDGVNLISRRRIETRLVKITLEEIARPYEIEVSVDGHPVLDLEKMCTDPRPQRFEVNFRLPEEIGPGLHSVNLNIGRRKMAPVPIEVTTPANQ
jgi:SAM-dependent methyltransferase